MPGWINIAKILRSKFIKVGYAWAHFLHMNEFHRILFRPKIMFSNSNEFKIISCDSTSIWQNVLLSFKFRRKFCKNLMNTTSCESIKMWPTFIIPAAYNFETSVCVIL